VRELEFLPEDYLRARFQRQVRFIRSWLLMAMGLAMVLWSLQMGAWVRQAQGELLKLHGTDSAVDGDVEKVRMLRAEAQIYNHRLEVLQAVKPRVTPTLVLAALAERLPAGVSLEDVIIESADREPVDTMLVRMRGVAPTEAAVTETLGAMETAPSFRQAVLVESREPAADGGPRRIFTIEARIVATPKEPRS
jgi:hypothetical protein